MTSSPPTLLQVRDLRTEFATGSGVIKAVRGVSLDVHEGEVLGLVGESGCGKSVTALSILRLIPQPPGRITSGSVKFEGQDLLTLPERDMRQVRGNRLSMIFQDPMTSLNPSLSIGSQVSEALRVHRGMRRDAAKERSAELLDMVGIPDPRATLRRYPHQLSGGMRQRVMIAMALSCGPRLLIADESTTALDVTIQAQILDLIRTLKNDNDMAMIMITHDLGVAAGITDRINVMYSGHTVESGPTDAIFANPSHPYTQGLLQSVPRLNLPRDVPLTHIEGSPPPLLQVAPGCPFQPRCSLAIDRCATEIPPLMTVGPDHRAACWVTAGSTTETAAAPTAAAVGAALS
jgi:oligopeptide transport system ATP-binding protein